VGDATQNLTLRQTDMPPAILRIVLAAGVASLAAMASAQVTDTEQRASLAATAAGWSVPEAAAPVTAEPDAPAFPIPANVLEETPRDGRKPVGTCSYDVQDRQISAACRRRLEIAQTL
jgi:hypothetical protein